MTTATKPKPKKKRARQVLIKEVEDLRHPKLDDMFDERADKSGDLSSLRSQIGEINESIREYMEENKLESYEHGGYKAVFEEGQPELVIKKIKEPKPEPANK